MVIVGGSFQTLLLLQWGTVGAVILAKVKVTSHHNWTWFLLLISGPVGYLLESQPIHAGSNHHQGQGRNLLVLLLESCWSPPFILVASWTKTR